MFNTCHTTSHTHWHTHLHTCLILTGADVDGKQVESARLLAALTAQVVKTNGWTELCIHMEIIYISNMYIYTAQWREREREAHEHIPSSLFFLFGVFPVFFLSCCAQTHFPSHH